MYRLTPAILASALLATSAAAVPVDLTGWTSNSYTNGTWTIQNPPANDSVRQSVNGDPTLFFDPGTTAQGTQLSGTITVRDGAGDDDFIGFALGYEDDEINSASADFILIDWKKNTQNYFGSVANAGLALSRISGDLSSVDLLGTYWGHETGSNANEIARATTLGATGWVTNQTYTFDLVFLPTLIQVYVDSVLQLSVTSAQAGVAAFDDGAFAFYNYSQANVEYAGITEEILPPPPPTGVPAPGAIALLGLGVAGMAGLRRRRAD